MAPRRKDEGKQGSNNGGRVKFRYVDTERYLDIDMEGANDAVADGLKQLASALSSGKALPAIGRKPPTLPPPPNGGSPAEQPEEEEVIGPELDSEDSEVADEPEEIAEGKPKKKYAPKAPKFLSEIDLSTATVPLEEFVKQKNPKDTFDKYAVIALWFKEQMKIEEVTVDHIYTAYCALDWKSQMPEHPTQTLHDLKNKKHWFDKGSAPRTFKLNWSGESAVNKMAAA
jgi:hypothetical protein